MNPNTIFCLLLTCLLTSSVFSQSIEATLIDQDTKDPIPFATVSLNQKSGIISSEKGEFTFHLPSEISEQDSIYIRSLGYKERVVQALNFTDSVIELHPEDIILGEVVLLYNEYTVDQIMEKVLDSLQANYLPRYSSQRIFYRDSDINKMNQFDVDVKQSTIEEFNQDFADQIIDEFPKEFPYHRELLADLYLKCSANGVEELKLNPIKACELYDKDNEFSSDKLEGKLQDLLRKHVKRNSYFKIKSGLIGTKTDEIDSSFFNQKVDSLITAKDSVENQKKSKEHFNSSLRVGIRNFLNDNFFRDDSDLDVIHNQRKYEFNLDGLTYIDNELVYRITFEPKRGDYSGKVYVHTDDFGVMRIDYQNVEPLRKINLFGISFRHDLKQGTYMYSRDQNGGYSLKFQEESNSIIFGIDRAVKIIEKNKHVKGRRKQNQVRLGVDFKIRNSQKKTLLVFDDVPLTFESFAEIDGQGDIEPVYLPQYDPMFWKGYNILTPNEAITEFKSLE